MIHQSGGSIVCLENYAKWDCWHGKPKGLPWSSVLEASCVRGLASTLAQGNMRNLATVWRKQIDPDSPTIDLLNDIWSRRADKSQTTFVLSYGEDDFFAVLGSQHGKGILRMLERNPALFGQKVVTSATVIFRNGGTHIRFGLTHWGPKAPPAAPLAPEPDSPLSRKQRRKLLKSSTKSS